MILLPCVGHTELIGEDTLLDFLCRLMNARYGTATRTLGLFSQKQRWRSARCLNALAVISIA